MAPLKQESTQQTFFENNSYKSFETADAGFAFEQEIFLHLCLRFHELNYESFSLGYEVDHIPKFDDVVCEFKSAEQNCIFAIQTKHILRDSMLIETKHLFASDSDLRKGHLWRPFNLRTYCKAIEAFRKGNKFQESVKFIVITNRKIDYDVECKMEEVSDDNIKAIFSKVAEQGTKVCKFNEHSKADFRKILSKDNFDELFDIIKENFIFVSSLNFKTLTDLNSRITSDLFKKPSQDSTPDKIRKIIWEHIEFDCKNRVRNTLRKSDLENILRCIVKSDLAEISENFMKNIAGMELVEFKNEILQNIFQRIKEGINLFECREYLEVNALKIFQAIENSGEKVLIIRWSALTEQQKTALKSWNEHKIVILLDENESEQISRGNLMLIFAKESKKNDENDLRFTVNDLSANAKRDFFEMKVKFQNFEVDIQKLFEMESEKIEKLQITLFSKLVKEKLLTIAAAIPENRTNQVTYINRQFSKYESRDEESEKEYFSEVKLLDGFKFCIVLSDAGMGKSVTLQKMAIDFKRKNPHFWVEFIELGQMTQMFYNYQMTSYHSVFCDIDEAKDFLLQHLVNHGNNLELSRNFFEYYLCLENPPIFLVFDGFDEIVPHYSELVLNLIEKMSSLNIKIFVSGRIFCEKILRRLKKFNVMILESLNEKEITDFLNKVLGNSFDFSNRKIIKNLERLLSNPLFLTISAHIFLEEYKKSKSLESLSSQIELLNELSIHERIFEQSFNNFYEKLGSSPISLFAKYRREREMYDAREMYTILAFHELNFENYYFLHDNTINYLEIFPHGLLKRRKDGSFNFIHKSFAEYFCAVELEKQLSRNPENLDQIETFLKRPDVQVSKFIEQIKMRNNNQITTEN